MKGTSVLAFFGLLYCVQGVDSCPSRQRRLACALLNHQNVIAATSHPSGEQDNAYAYNNLRDMCSGDKASRSSYRCSPRCRAPGGSVCLSEDLLTYLVALAESGIVQINELAGACHSCTSRHYSGLAVDLHKIPAREDTYVEQCEQHGGWALRESNHIHCHFYDAPHPNL